jgi:hypothetical protein
MAEVAQGRTENTVRGNKGPSSANSTVNALDMMIKEGIDGICTASVVTVTGTDEPGPEAPAGYVTVQEMVDSVDAFGNKVPGPSAFKLPVFRYQQGTCAIVLDPQPGDIGLAVYTKEDASGVGQGATEPVLPASKRKFDKANGFYLGGFTNRTPTEMYFWVDKTGFVKLFTRENIEIETEKDCAFKVQGNMSIDVQGNMSTRISGGHSLKAGSISTDGPTSMKGGITNQGGISNSGGSVSSNGKVLDSHTHPGDSGGVTGPPN